MRENGLNEIPMALKTLRAVQGSMLASILLYEIAGEVLGPRAHMVDSSLSSIFSTLSVGVVGTIFVVRRTLVFGAATRLAASRRQHQPQPVENRLHDHLRAVRSAGPVRTRVALPRMHAGAERAVLWRRVCALVFLPSAATGWGLMSSSWESAPMLSRHRNN